MPTILEAARLGEARLEQRRRWRENQSAYCARMRLKIICIIVQVQALGKPHCVDCDEQDLDELEYDHLQPRTWTSREYWRTQRLRKMLDEARAGQLTLRCRSCNAAKGKPRYRRGRV